MKTIRYLLIFVVTAVLPLVPTSAVADGLPGFVQVGKTYRELGGPVFVVLDVDVTGWARVRQSGKVFWLNLNKLAGIEEVD